MAAKRSSTDIYGDLIFEAVYRNVKNDLDLCMQARRRLKPSQKLISLWLWLSVMALPFLLIKEPPFIFFNGIWHLQSPVPLLLIILFLIISAQFFWLRYRWKKQWRELSEDNSRFHCFGYKNAFVIFKETPDLRSMSQKELKKIEIVSERWNKLLGFEITADQIFFITNDQRVYLISNRDFKGTGSFEEIGHQVKSILQHSRKGGPPIASPR